EKEREKEEGKEKEKDKTEKEKEKEVSDPIDELPRKRIPAAVWSGLIAAVFGAGAGWLIRGNPTPPAPPPASAPAPVVARPAPMADAAVVKEIPKPEPPKPEPAPIFGPPAPRCTASITSMPSGAEVTWGGKSLGKTPLESASVPCGEADVKVEHERLDV